MATELAVTTTEFDEKVLKSDVPVLVDFWAQWCGPCRAIGPHVEEIAKELDGQARVYKINVDEEGEIAQKYGIMSIPALLVFKGGQVVDQMVGAGPKDSIKALVTKHI
ncbi:MAG: thioredoxin [Armatimonadetes bacterium]|nr:thioredoxin [Armatimonadota bacterium]